MQQPTNEALAEHLKNIAEFTSDIFFHNCTRAQRNECTAESLGDLMEDLKGIDEHIRQAFLCASLMQQELNNPAQATTPPPAT